MLKYVFFVLTVLYPYLNLHMKSLGISIQVSDFIVAKILYKSVRLIGEWFISREVGPQSLIYIRVIP